MPKIFSVYAAALALHVLLAWVLARFFPFPPGSLGDRSPWFGAFVVSYVGLTGFILNFVITYFVVEVRDMRRKRELELARDVMES